MALPTINTVIDCADWSKAVEPYAPQLYDLPHQILQTFRSPHALKELYLSTNPLISGFALSLFLAPVFLAVSEANKNYSQVDRCWSLLPTLYNAHYVLYAHATGLPTKRMDALLAFSTIWSMRLTYNYWRKGGYTVGSEDYRWEVLKKYIGPFLFLPFNIVFIALIQSVLLFSITMPTYVLLLASQVTGEQMLPLDIGFSQGLVGLVLLSAIADQQQWSMQSVPHLEVPKADHADFQNAKRSYRSSAKLPTGYNQKDLDRGFLTGGLWAYSRHPNFAAEQSVWVGLYLWSCYVTETYYNWSGIGVIGYLVLFQASTWFTELLSSGKYPEYKEYRKKVAMFVPGLLSLSSSGFNDGRSDDNKTK